jgi:hypothetical protein
VFQPYPSVSPVLLLLSHLPAPALTYPPCSLYPLLPVHTASSPRALPRRQVALAAAREEARTAKAHAEALQLQLALAPGPALRQQADVLKAQVSVCDVLKAQVSVSHVPPTCSRLPLAAGFYGPLIRSC